MWTPRSRQIFRASRSLISASRGTAVRRPVLGVLPPGVARSLAHEGTSTRSEVSDQIAALHADIDTSSKSLPATMRACSRFISIASASADAKLSGSSSRVSPWELTPAISSTQPIHHAPSRLMTA